MVLDLYQRILHVKIVFDFTPCTFEQQKRPFGPQNDKFLSWKIHGNVL